MMLRHTFRRALATFGTVLLVFLLGTGAVGLATADDNQGSDHFVLAQHNGGDSGSRMDRLFYDGVEQHGSISSATIGLNAAPDDGDKPTEPVVFAWSDARVWTGADGVSHAVHVQQIIDPNSGNRAAVNGREVFTPDTTWTFVDLAGRTIAESRTSGGGASVSASANGQREVTTDFVTTNLDPAPACDLAAALRLGVDLREPIAPLGCPEGGLIMFRMAGTETLNGIPTVRFDSVDDSIHYSVWFNPAIPEAVRSEFVQDGDLEIRATSELVSFTAGTQPWDTPIAVPAPQARPALAFAPRQAWGADDADLEHPFKASQAWALAASDPVYQDFREYLTAHPEAATYRSDFDERLAGQQATRQWHFTIISNAEPFALDVVQDAGPAGSQATDLLGLPTITPVVARYSFSTVTIAMTGAPKPSELPAEMPTVASAMAYWSAVNATAPANAYGIDSCWPDCLASLNVGAALESSAAVTVIPGEDPLVSHHALLNFGPDGAPRRLEEERISSIRENGGPVQPGPGVEGFVDVGGSGITTAGVIGWAHLDGPAGATVGAASLLAGVLAWFWPLLKTGVAGLFSRVQAPDALEHPVRADLVARIEAQPGVHYQELRRATGLGKGTLEHHLRTLERTRLVKVVRGPHYTCYFPPSTGAKATQAAPMLKADGSRAVLQHVVAEPGLSGIELSRRTGLSPSTVNLHVHRLAEAGLLTGVREGRELRWRALPEAHGAA